MQRLAGNSSGTHTSSGENQLIFTGLATCGHKSNASDDAVISGVYRSVTPSSLLYSSTRIILHRHQAGGRRDNKQGRRRHTSRVLCTAGLFVAVNVTEHSIRRKYLVFESLIDCVVSCRVKFVTTRLRTGPEKTGLDAVVVYVGVLYSSATIRFDTIVYC
jgi:hypothetical protein